MGFLPSHFARFFLHRLQAVVQRAGRLAGLRGPSSSGLSCAASGGDCEVSIARRERERKSGG